VTQDSGSLTSRGSSPPRALAWTALVVCLAATVMTLWGAWRTGVAVDEPFHVFRLRNLFDTGWYLLDDDFDGSVPGSWVTDQYVYAPVATLLMHGVCVALGIEDPGAVSTSSAAYGTRHLVVAVTGLLGAVAVAATGRLVLRSWGWGVVAAGTLMAIPMWPGLSMFDIKDVPAATGYTLVTLGMVMCLRSTPGRLWMRAATAGTLATGAALAVGTRPGLWTGLAFGVVTVLVSSYGRDDTGRLAWTRWRLAELAVGLAVAYGVLWWAYPAMFSRPDRWLLSSALASSSYSGADLGTWSYIPSRVSGTMPPLLLMLGCVGCLAALRDWSGRRWSLHEVRICVVACQALALPVLAILRESHLYDDLRQVLFACPAAALLLTLGTKHLVADLGRSGGPVAWRFGLGLWAFALVVPLAVQLQLFPYNYAYASPQADLIGAPVENDFWRTSFRELLPKVTVDRFVMCSPASTADGLTLRYSTITGRPPAEAGTDCRLDPISPLTPYLDPLVLEAQAPGDTFIALFERGHSPGKNCEQLERISRQRYLTTQVMSTAARCRLVLNAYPSSSVVFRPDGSGAEFLLGGWTSNPARDGVRLREPAGSLGFELPEAWDGRSLRVLLEGEADEVPVISVNNEPVAATSTDTGWLLDVPATTVAAMGERRLVVTLAQPAGEPLVLARVSLEPS
jgi:hypothetical protein